MNSSDVVSRVERLNAAFHREELRAVRMMARSALAVIACIVPWITIENGLPAAFFLYAILAALLLLLFATRHLLARDVERRWPWYVFIATTAILVTVAFIANNPLQSTELPIAYRLGLGNQAYLFLIIVLSAFSFSPRIVAWAGTCCAGVWVLATLYALTRPDSLPPLTNADAMGMTSEHLAALAGDPRRVDIGESIRHVLAMLGVTAITALCVGQARRFVVGQVEAEDRRSNLARYFSPDLVEELAEGDARILGPSSHEVVIVFIDIVGFTRMVESWKPEAVLDLLRGYHGTIAPIVFRHGGTIDKYIGDGIMVTFGTLVAGSDDAANAMRCAQAILTGVDHWNEDRTSDGMVRVVVSIGVHTGPVVSGNVGGSDRLEYTVIGDAVNVASRIERLTRRLNTPLLASNAVVERIEDTSMYDLVRIDAQALPGRSAPIDVWAQANPTSPA